MFFNNYKEVKNFIFFKILSKSHLIMIADMSGVKVKKSSKKDV